MCNKYAVQIYFKGQSTIKDTLVASKEKDTIQQKLRSYAGLGEVGWTLMRSTLGSHLGPLLKGIRNILRHLHQYMNTSPTHASTQHWKTSA